MHYYYLYYCSIAQTQDSLTNEWLQKSSPIMFKNTLSNIGKFHLMVIEDLYLLKILLAFYFKFYYNRLGLYFLSWPASVALFWALW